MATPTLSRHTLAGVLGEILVDVRTSGRSSSRPTVVIMHGFKGFKDWGMFPPLAERLARAGFTAVSFNASGSGVNDAGDFVWLERFGHNTYSAELGDLETVLEALRSGKLGVVEPASVGLVGHSRGGGVAILATSRQPKIRALVTWAAIGTVDRWPESEKKNWRSNGRLEVPNMRTRQILPLYIDLLDDIERHAEGSLNIPAAAAQLSVPWLIIHGENDESVTVEDAHHLKRAATGERVRLLTVPDAGHTFGAVHPYAGSTPALEQVFDETVAWMGTWLE